GKRVMVGMNHRFRSDVQAVRGFLAGGDLGGLQAVRGGWYTFQPSRQLLGWRLRREQAGGGAVLDLGLPLIDLGMWLAGWPAPKRISAHVVRAGKNAVEDMGSVLIVCENGVSITMDVSWRHLGQGERFWFDLVGAKGSAMIQPLRIFKEQHGAAVDVTPTGAIGRETQFTQSDRAHPQLPAVPPSNPQLLRDHAGRPLAPAGGGGSRSARRVSLGLVVRPDHERPRTLLDGRGPVALHAVFRARLSRDDRDHRPV